MPKREEDVAAAARVVLSDVADVGTLKAAGYREEQIFEVTIAAALGAALRGIDAGLRVVGESEDETGDT